MGKWWDKLRRAWIAIRSGLHLNSNRKSAGTNKEKKRDKGAMSEAETEEIDGYAMSGAEADEEMNGYLTLKREIENCDDEDVHVLWEMLIAQARATGEQPD